MTAITTRSTKWSQWSSEGTSLTRTTQASRSTATGTSKKRPPPVRKQKIVRLSKRVHDNDDDGREWLVESPRRIQFERTTLGFTNPLADSLTEFYEDVVVVADEDVKAAKAAADKLMDYIVPRVTKLANAIGMKVMGRLLISSTHDGSVVLDPKVMEVFILFDRHKTKVDSLEPGYRYIPLRRYREKKGAPPDQHRYGRSEDQMYLSSLIVARQMHQLVERSLKLHPDANLWPFTIEDGQTQIVVEQGPYTVNIIPACYVETEDVYFITRPYTYDMNPSSDMMWRMSFIMKERKILKRIDQADRGMRKKAFLCLKALVRKEHTLKGLTSYHIKTVLLHTFDDTVDSTPRWQRNSIDSCFIDLLRELNHFLSRGYLPHFFVRDCNLFDNMEPRTLASLKSRIGFLVQNHGEVIRVLKKFYLNVYTPRAESLPQ